MDIKDQLIFSNKLEYKPGPEPVVENVMSAKQIEARIDEMGRDIEPIVIPYFWNKITTKDNEPSVLNDIFLLDAVSRIERLATDAIDKYANSSKDISKEDVESLIKRLEQDNKLKAVKYIIRVLKSRSRHITITACNLTIYWNKVVYKRINLIKTKKTKHGKSKLIKFKTTVRSRQDEPIGKITF